MTFNNKYLKIKELAQQELSIIEKNIISLIDTREPLNSYIKNFISAPSKRIRSVVAILYNKAQGYEITNKQIELLSAIELVHNASLIHDDIIDKSDIRRGEKTICSKFDNKLGVISGDYLLSIAMTIIAKLNSNCILEKFSKTLKQMCIGEINQNFDRFKIGTIEEYIEKSKNKTAYLFETALVCCDILNDYHDNIKNCSDFALNFGIAFQIRDDLINILKKDKTKSSTDIDEGIYNAPIIYSGSVDKYEQGIEKTKHLLNNYIEIAKNFTNNFEKNSYTLALQELLELLNND